MRVTFQYARLLLALFGLFGLVFPAGAATFTYDGGAAQADPPRDPKNWFDPANWSPDGVPGPADTAVLDPTSPVTPVLTGDMTVANLIVQGHIEGTGGLTVTNSFEWRGGNVSGTLNVPAGATLTVKQTGGPLGLDGRFGAGILNNAGTVIMEPTAHISAFGGSNTAILNSGTFIGQTVEGTGSAFLGWSAFGDQENQRPTLFRNTGTFRQTGANSGSNAVNFMRWENRGTLEVQGGGLVFSGVQMENSGTIDVGEGAILDLYTDAAVQFQEDSLITGPGRVRAIGDPVTADGTVTLGVAPVGDAPGKPGTFEIQMGETRGNLTLVTTPDGRAVWSGGFVSGTLTNPLGSRLLLGEGEHAQNNLVLDSRRGAGILNNAGEAVLAPFAQINGLSGGTPAIQNSGTLELQVGDDVGRATIGTNRLSDATGNLLLRNTGLLKNTGGNGQNVLQDIRLENPGTILIQNGSIGFRKDTIDHSGALNVAPGSNAFFGADTVVTLGAGNRLTGGGRARIDSEYATFNGTLNLGSAEDPTGTFELMGAAGLKGDLTLNAVGQAGAVWSGGTLAGALRIPSGTTLLISGGGHVLDGSFGGALLDNAGTMILEEDAAIANILGKAEIRNAGTFELRVADQTGRSALGFTPGDDFTLRNTGLIRNTGGNGTNILAAMTFENPGTIQLQNGGISVRNAAFSHTGVIQSAEGTVFDFGNDAVTTFGEGARFVGGGRARVNGTPTLNGTLTLGSAEVPDGTFELLPATTLLGNLTLAAVGQGGAVWSGGVLAGQLHIAPGASLTLTGTDHVMEGSAGGALLDNAGRVTMLPETTITARLGAAEIRNSGLFDVQTGSGANRNFISNNNPAGENPLAFQNLAGGRLQKSGGTDSLVSTGVKLTNAGSFSIEKGEVDLRSGGFTQTSTGVLDLGIGGPAPLADFGRLTVDGTAALDGTVHARLVNNYVPGEGGAFGAIAYTARTGELARAEMEGLEGFTLEPQYGDAGLNLVVKKLPGDVNGDSGVDINDAVLTLKEIVDLFEPTSPQQLAAMDLNGDGQVNIVDVIFILKIVVGIE